MFILSSLMGAPEVTHPLKIASCLAMTMQQRSHSKNHKMEKGGCIYIMTNKNNTTFYIGVTSDLIARVSEYKSKYYPGSFISRYDLTKLVYIENFHSIEEAIAREKQIKAGSRKAKINLILTMNPGWNDLYDSILDEW